MTLRSNQRTRFFTLLEKNFPGLVERYKKLYGTSKEPSREYLVEVNRRALELCKVLRIGSYIPPPTMERPLKENFEVANILLLIAYFKEKMKGNPYVVWSYHKAPENIEDLGESIKEIHTKSG